MRRSRNDRNRSLNLLVAATAFPLLPFKKPPYSNFLFTPPSITSLPRKHRLNPLFS